MSPQPRRPTAQTGAAGFAELEARVAALESAEIKLKDLPLGPLQRKLEQDWQPNANLLLGQAFVDTTVYTADSGIVLAGATATGIVVPHSLGKVPVGLLGGLQDGAWADQFGWSWAAATETAVTINFGNLGPNTGQAFLKFVLVPPS